MKAVYTARGDGLGTRMLSALYARILAEHLGLPLKVIWAPLGGASIYADYGLMHPDFLLDIFADRTLFRDANPGLCGVILRSDAIADVRLRSLYHSIDQLAGLSADELRDALGESEDLLYDFPGPLITFMSSEINLGSALTAAWSKVNWSAAVLEAVGCIGRRIDLPTCTAVHVRRGDILDVVNRADLEHLVNDGMVQVLQRYTPLAAFFQQIDASRQLGDILVCTEDADVVRRFADRYGRARVASSIGLDLTENQRAATDLLLLSKARQIFAPAVSFFSHCAAAVSGARLVNTAWELEASVAEILAFVDRSDAKRVRQISAIAYAAASRLASGQDPDLALRFRAQGFDFDEGLSRRVLVEPQPAD
ncbi:hypothetical protein [Methylobacterium sp. V23]|uniref:hypothetical protein n=1 Tax=Methylobacterium sp. V23 TaxID=2044878 RepID=UPI000CDA89F8|nr:hypothetical protein [Methylobacterium sp. V23]POR42499.1 hypothetical protein CRT23_13700 [Methylobacterium sp. V23]